MITLDEYVNNMKKDQKEIYYACGETTDRIDLVPQVEQVKAHDFDILYFTNPVDEFTIQTLQTYKEKTFKNIADGSLDLFTKEEKEKLNKLNEDSKELLSFIKESLDENVVDVRFTNKLKSHPVCLTTEGNVSIEMQKVINSMPTDEKINAKMILEINESHPIVEKIKKLYENNKEELKSYSKVLYSQARLIEGLSIDNPTEISNIICQLISK